MFKFSRARVTSIALATLLVLSAPALALPLGSKPRPGILDPQLAAQLAGAKAGDELLVFVHSGSIEGARTAVENGGLRLFDSFDKIGVAVAIGTPDEILQTSGMPEVLYIEGDRPLEYFLDTADDATRDDAVLSGFTSGSTTIPGLDGSGVSIAVVDSGVDGTHPMFQQSGQSRVVRNLKLACVPVVDCTGPIGNARDAEFIDIATNDTDTISAGGHGTHVAAIAAGGEAEALDGAGTRILRGAAPGAKVVGLSIGFVISAYGGVAGLNWVLEHNADPCSGCPPIKVVNSSWGTSGGAGNPNSALSKIEDALVAAGVTVVFAAGNEGGDGTAISTNPEGNNPTPGVISVANYDDFDKGLRDLQLADSSSRGQVGLFDTYPDVSAPGSRITSACSPTLTVCRGFDKDPRYGTISGTSMAAPYVAGAVAQLIQGYRIKFGSDPAPAYLENLLEDTAYKFLAGGAYEPDPDNSNDTTSFDKGHGLLDVKAAAAEIFAAPLAETDPSPTAECASSSLVDDPAGDTYAVAFFPDSRDETHVPPDEAQLDIRKVSASWDGTALTFEMDLEDLQTSNPQGAPSILYTVHFTHAGKALYVDAARSSNGATSFGFGRVQNLVATTARVFVSSITGSFDAATDKVTMRLPNSAIPSGTAPQIADGNSITAIAAHARIGAKHPAGSAGQAVDVTDPTPCRYVIGTGVQPPAPPPPLPPVVGTLSAGSSDAWTAGPFTTTTTAVCSGPADTRCDRRRYQVVVPSGGVATLKATAQPESGSDFDLFVFGPDGTEIGSSANGGDTEEIFEEEIVGGGIYTVAVLPWDAQDNTYSGTISLTGLANDATVAYGGSYSWTSDPILDSSGAFTALGLLGDSSCTGPNDPFCDRTRVNLNLSGPAVLTVRTASEDPTADFDLVVYGSDGAEISRSAHDGSTEEVVAWVPSGGVITVMVSPFASAGASYTGTVIVGAEQTPGAAFDGVAELAGSAYTWLGDPPVDVNPVLRCISLGDHLCDIERVWLKGIPISGATLTVTITGGGGDFDNFSVYIVDPSGNFLAMSEDGGGTTKTLTARVNSLGVYRIGVSASFGPGQTFTGSASLTN